MTAPPVVTQHRTPAPAAIALPWAKLAAATVVLAVVIASFVQARKPTAQLADFGAYYRAGQAVVAGRSPYTLDANYRELGAYMYCPAFAHLVCRPLARLPYPWAVRTFLVVNWAATVAVVALSLRLAGRAGFLVGVIALAAAGTYLWADLHNGQVGTLLVLACLGWLSLTLAGWPILGGVALSLAVGLKIYPLLLAPYLLLRRQWWPGLVGLAAGLLLQFVAPAVFVGSRGMLPLHRQWLAFCLQTQSWQQTVRAGNQSLLGVLARTPRVSDGVHLFSQPHLDALQHAYPAVVLVVTAALYGWVLARRARRPVVDVSVLLVWMTLASPRAWTFNFAAVVPAAVLMAAAVVARRPRWPLAAVALAGVLAAIVLPTNRLPPSHGWSWGIAVLLDKHFIAAVALAAAVGVVGFEPPGTRQRTDRSDVVNRSTPGCGGGMSPNPPVLAVTRATEQT